jgi:hypothetical protein
LEGQFAALQTTVTANNQHPVFALDPFVTVSPGSVNGVNGPNILFTGANIHIRSGSGTTYEGSGVTGRGNLIIGYDEINGQLQPGDRGGSHNLILGLYHKFTYKPEVSQLAYGGCVIGFSNTITQPGASVFGGNGNTSSGSQSIVVGGQNNLAGNTGGVILGGYQNTANGALSSVVGGRNNLTSSDWSVILGGFQQTAASAFYSIAPQNLTLSPK